MEENNKNININLFGEKFGEYIGKEIDEHDLGKETLNLGKTALILHYIKEFAIVLMGIGLVVIVALVLLTDTFAHEGQVRSETKLGKSTYEIYQDGQWQQIDKETYKSLTKHRPN